VYERSPTVEGVSIGLSGSESTIAEWVDCCSLEVKMSVSSLERKRLCVNSLSRMQGSRIQAVEAYKAEAAGRHVTAGGRDRHGLMSLQG
jgi:hypothetical protein